MIIAFCLDCEGFREISPHGECISCQSKSITYNVVNHTLADKEWIAEVRDGN